MKRLLLVFFCLTLTAFAQNSNDRVATVNFEVRKSFNDKPVRNAAIVLHIVGKSGKQSKGGTELKTDPDGKTHYQGIPYGKLRIQVIADGLQTFGEDVDINQPVHDILVKMDKPKPQVTIYGDEKKKDEPKPDEKKPDAKPPANPKQS